MVVVLNATNPINQIQIAKGIILSANLKYTELDNQVDIARPDSLTRLPTQPGTRAKPLAAHLR